ncbi:hypothetical protein ACN38_g10244 [Penicillium nordicum]|uniref:Uncharacterized protein n=1 Tax=Penicillium nordicum TaxID=229535 RepID=A0A0M8NUA4_9EURO|nr:hypothetical protein ACN38_g10244 [Penicillium nordicum]
MPKPGYTTYGQLVNFYISPGLSAISFLGAWVLEAQDPHGTDPLCAFLSLLLSFSSPSNHIDESHSVVSPYCNPVGSLSRFNSNHVLFPFPWCHIFALWLGC